MNKKCKEISVHSSGVALLFMLRIRPAAGVEGLYELIDEKGQSCLDADAIRSKLGKPVKRDLKNTLALICQALKIRGMGALLDFIEEGLLKKIDRNSRAVEHNLWEIRNPAHGGRLFFIMDEEGQIIVSAVDKFATQDSKAQDKAINRGINRWENFLSKI